MSDMERMIELVKRGDEWASRALTAEQQVEDLSAEVARLREGIERLSNSWEDFDEPAPWRSPSYFAALNRCAYEARALLNPPTEGDDHE